MAQEGIDWNPNNRAPIRPNMHACEVFFTPLEKIKKNSTLERINTSVGIPLLKGRGEQFRTQHDIEKFSRQVDRMIKDRGVAEIQKGHFYVTGIRFDQNEKEIKTKYETILKEKGIDPNRTKIVILSVPPGKYKKLSLMGVKALIYKLGLSLRRDFEKPFTEELINSLLTAVVLVEIPTAIWLYNNYSGTEFAVSAAVHFAWLSTVFAFGKTVGNWILRPGTSKKIIFLKQMLLSTPFVANFALSTNIDEISAFVNANGWGGFLDATPEAMASFAITQGPGIALQTMFYTTVVAKGYLDWMNNVKGAQQSDRARASMPWLRLPYLMADSLGVAWIGANVGVMYQHTWDKLQIPFMTKPLEDISFSINSGHAIVAGLTIYGWLMARDYFLNPALKNWTQAEENHSKNPFMRYLAKGKEIFIPGFLKNAPDVLKDIRATMKDAREINSITNAIKNRFGSERIRTRIKNKSAPKKETNGSKKQSFAIQIPRPLFA